MLEVSHLSKEFKSAAGDVVAVDDVSFNVAKSKLAAIIGKSGSGKSTLLSLLGALDRPSDGNIKMDGKDITKLRDGQLTKYRRHTIGFVFQNYSLVPNLSALENVMLPMEFAGLSTHKRRSRAEHLLDQVGLSADKYFRLPSRLSGGEQQRVAIARALANKPKLLLADEPTGNLDSETGKMIVDLLHALSRSEDTTIIAVTHDTSISRRADVTFRLHDGRLIR